MVLVDKKETDPMVIPRPEPLPPLFPAWNTPAGSFPAIYAWRAYTNPVQSISSVIGNETPLSAIPAEVVAMVYYHSPPNQPPDVSVRKTFDYGDVRPYTFYMPDGSTRTNSTGMSQQAYNQLVNNIWSSDQYPT